MGLAHPARGRDRRGQRGRGLLGGTPRGSARGRAAPACGLLVARARHNRGDEATGRCDGGLGPDRDATLRVVTARYVPSRRRPKPAPRRRDTGAIDDGVAGHRGASAAQRRASAPRRQPGAGVGVSAGAGSAGPERKAGRRAGRRRHDRPLRPRRPPLRRRHGGGVRPAPPRQRLPRPCRTGLRANGFARDRRLTASEVRIMMKNVGSRALVALLCGAGFSAACSGGGAVNIGNTAVIGSQLSDYAASWDGYAEAYTFMPDGSDRVRLTIDANGQGTLEVGNAALLPPPTDPNVGYRPALSSIPRSWPPPSPASWSKDSSFPSTRPACRRIGFSWGRTPRICMPPGARCRRPSRPTKRPSRRTAESQRRSAARATRGSFRPSIPAPPTSPA